MKPPRPGDRQIEDGKLFRRSVGSSPNGVSNGWFSRHIGKSISAYLGDLRIVRGVLVGFDSYSVEIQRDTADADTVLLFKGPGLEFLSE